MRSCPPRQQLQMLLDENLSAKERRDLEAHVQTCSSCRQLLDRMVDGRSKSNRDALHPPAAGDEPVSLPVSVNPTPASLLERLCRPDAVDAWGLFAELYTPLLFSWARRAGLQEADAADLVQEVFAALVRKLPTFRYEIDGSFRGWLRTVLRNKWSELNRRWSPPTQAGAAVEELADPASDLLDGPGYQQELVGRALRLLRPEFQQAAWEPFWQTAVLGRPVREVAMELGISNNAVYVARCRVLQRLRRELAGLLG
jgi:RNA polymerase sigma-70 factor, ECF subfamily